MHRTTLEEMSKAYKELGIRHGDVVHVQSDLRRIGPVDAEMTFEGLCGFHLKALQQAVGLKGTITCQTSFEDYGRYETPFIVEESPSRTDTLSEYIRQQPGAIRSLHPIVSVCGIGARAEEICGGTHYDGYGYLSPWARLHRADAKILSLGLNKTNGGTSFVHYCEQLFGLPYLYTKIFKAPVYKDGQKIEQPFSMLVRYLDFAISYDNRRVKQRLTDEGFGREAKTGRTQSWCISAEDMAANMMRYFEEDRWVMLANPPKFRAGELPMDGVSGELQVSADKADEETS